MDPRAGRLPPTLIQQVVRSHFDEYRRCYEDGLRRDPGLEGRVMVRFVIGRDGRIGQINEGEGAPKGAFDWTDKNLAPAPAFKRMPDRRVVTCVLARFQELDFPPPDGGIVTVYYPITFAATE